MHTNANKISENNLRKKRRVQHINITLNRSEIEDAKGNITSKFFINKENTSSINLKTEFEDKFNIDVNAVKSMGPLEYFERMDIITDDDPNQWSEPLPDNIIEKIEKNEDSPSNFLPIYSKIRLLRSQIITPVDTMGCPRIPILVSRRFDIMRDKLLPNDYRVQLIISLILSSQTKDEIVTQAMFNIMNHCVSILKDKRGISLESLLVLDQETFERLIKPTGFYKKKTIYIMQTIRQLRERFDGDVPTDITGMMSLPGVGPKIGYLALQKAWGKIDGICVDVHVHRLCNMWKWVDPQVGKDAEHTRIQLEKWLPRELWYEFNTILVGHGQIICGPKVRRCELCLANKVCNASSIRN